MGNTLNSPEDLTVARAKFEELTRNNASLEFELEESKKTVEAIQSGYREAKLKQRTAETQLEECRAEKKKLEILVNNTKKQTCMRDYRAVKRLGQGSYGVVDQVCKDKDCKYVMKIQANKGRSTELEVDVWLYVQRKLAGIAPQLYNRWPCGREYFIVSDLFDNNMHSIGFKQLQESNLNPSRYPKLSYVLTESQLLQMIGIAQLLTMNGIVHGDLKPDNFLFRARDSRVAVTDFGLTGFLSKMYSDDAGLEAYLPPYNGFSSGPTYGCPGQGFINVGHPWHRYLDLLNMWQISTCLVEMGTLIDTGIGSVPRFLAFTGVNFGGKTRESLAMTQSCKGPVIQTRLPLLLKSFNDIAIPKYLVSDAKLKNEMRKLLSR